MSDYVTWATNTGILVIGQLPLQDFDAAVNLAFNYVLAVGGWVPDDPDHPDGEGHPFNNASEATAAAEITAEQIGSVYDLKVIVTTNLSCQFSQYLGTGLTLEAAAAAMAADVGNFLTDSINNSDLPLRLEEFGAQTAPPDRSLLGGYTTQDVRLNIAADVISTDKPIDYKVIALRQATTVNGLDGTWNVQYVYTEEGSSIVVVIAKYTGTDYFTLDTGSGTLYVYTVSPTTHQIVSGIVVNS